jgi:hypothetical protein
MTSLKSRKILDLTILTNPPVEIGVGPYGRRMVAYLRGGRFKGDGELRGEVLPGGGDWLLIRPDGVRMLDVKATLRCEDGAAINIAYAGRWIADPGHADEVYDREKAHLVNPAKYAIRAQITFETGAPRYAFLNDVAAIGLGRRISGGVQYAVHEIADRNLDET